MNTLDNFSIELLRIVLHSLDIDSLYTCSSVCRTWHKEIQSMAYKRVIVRNDDELPLIMTKYADPANGGGGGGGAKVQELILDCGQDAISLVASNLPKTFPNLRSIHSPTCKQLAEVMEEWDKLESISESASDTCETVEYLLLISTKSFFADRLTSLELKFGSGSSQLDRDVCIAASAYGLKDITIPLLEYCPNLEHLGLKNTFVEPADVELIHDNLPRLKTLRLKNIILLERRKGKKAPKHPVVEDPACDMKQVYISTVTRGSQSTPEERVHKDWLDYFAEKYPNLESLTFYASTKVANPHQRQQAHIKQLIKLVKHCRRLKELRIKFIGGFSEKLATELDLNQIQLESASVHGNAVSTTEQLHRLAKHHKELKKLRIETLHLKKSESPPLDLYALGKAMSPFQNLQQVTVKKWFDLCYTNASQFDDHCSYKLLHALLKYCKKLTSISFCMNATFTKPINEEEEEMYELPVAHNLKYLNIHTFVVGQAEMDYLNNVILPSCPNLTHLRLVPTSRVHGKYCYRSLIIPRKPTVLHIRLRHQHQLTCVFIQLWVPGPLLLKVLPDESLEDASPKRWFEKETLKEISTTPDLGRGYTVLYIHPECLDAFLNRPSPRCKSIVF